MCEQFFIPIVHVPVASGHPLHRDTLKDENSVDAGNDTTQRTTETPQRVVSTMTIFIPKLIAAFYACGCDVSIWTQVECGPEFCRSRGNLI